MKDIFNTTTAITEKDFSQAKILFLEYAEELHLDLCFHNFDKELKEIAMLYNFPYGILLMLKNRNKVIGCAGLRKINGEISEMKRMYINKCFRGKGLSEKLIKKLPERARKMKYKCVRLDTLPQMKEAISLYLLDIIQIKFLYE